MLKPRRGRRQVGVAPWSCRVMMESQEGEKERFYSADEVGTHNGRRPGSHHVSQPAPRGLADPAGGRFSTPYRRGTAMEGSMPR